MFAGVFAGVCTEPPPIFTVPSFNFADTLAKLLSPKVAPLTFTVAFPDPTALNVSFTNTPFWLMYPFDIV